MTVYSIRLGAIGTNPKSKTEEEIRADIALSRDNIAHLQADNQKALVALNAGKKPDNRYHDPHSIKRLKTETFGFNIYYPDMSDVVEKPHKYLYGSTMSKKEYNSRACGQHISRINSGNVIFADALARIKKFEKRLNKSILKPGDWFPIWALQDGEKDRWMVHHYGISDYSICDVCHDSVRDDKLALHKSKVRCIYTGKRAKLVEDGWAFIGKGSKLANAALRNEVEYDLVPVDYDIYVPKWVAEAGEMYDKNKGYAKMSISEFINKMKPKEK